MRVTFNIQLPEHNTSSEEKNVPLLVSKIIDK